jgi:hypothetical protein
MLKKYYNWYLFKNIFIAQRAHLQWTSTLDAHDDLLSCGNIETGLHKSTKHHQLTIQQENSQSNEQMADQLVEDALRDAGYSEAAIKSRSPISRLIKRKHID